MTFPEEKLLDRLTRIDELLEMVINQLSIISGVPPQRAPFTIPISITELIHTLINAGKAHGYFLIDSLTINPLTQVTYTIDITRGYRGAPIEFLALPDPDHVLQMYIKLDGVPFAYDDDMVAAIYTEPIEFLKDYFHLIYAMDKIEVVFINPSTTTTATINFRFAWAEIRDAEWQRIMDKYYKVVEEWLLK